MGGRAAWRPGAWRVSLRTDGFRMAAPRVGAGGGAGHDRAREGKIQRLTHEGDDMKRSFRAATVILLFVLAASPAIRADVRSDEKSKIEFTGMLGRMVNMFGGKGAREGVV